MGQNSQTTAQNQNQVTSPWAPAIPGLTNIINQLSNGGGPLTSGQSQALNSLQQTGSTLPGFGQQSANAVGQMFGSNPGILSNAYNNFSSALSPYLSSNFTNPMTTPGLGTQLQTLNQNITNSVNGMFAGAGRDPSGNAAASKALATGLAQGEAPVLTNEFNTLGGMQLGAANSLLGGAGSTASGLSGLGLQAMQGASAMPGIWNQPGATQLNIANMGQQLPFQNLQLPASMLGSIASLGGQGTNTGTSTVTSPVNPWTTAAGIGLGALSLWPKSSS